MRGFADSQRSLKFLVEANGGLTEIHGEARLEGADLILEFESCDSLSGLLRKPGHFSMPVDEIEEIKLHRGIINTRLTVKSKSIDAIRGLKWRSGHKFRLGLRRADRPEALAFVDDVHWLMENQL